MSEPVKVTKHINASPEAVWNLVTDLTRMGDWSPENKGGNWVKGATGAEVGAKFKGVNSNGKVT
ncbi:MAG: SRPBCC family protein, partial [Actinomycetota bacterium]|nr:SRPBCC family protein [Actinomycetota bacterium]